MIFAIWKLSTLVESHTYLKIHFKFQQVHKGYFRCYAIATTISELYSQILLGDK